MYHFYFHFGNSTNQIDQTNIEFYLKVQVDELCLFDFYF